jgi:hypothetical protein
MMLKLCGPFGCTVSLDFRERFGESIELECFQFLIAPIEFRLVRNSRPLQEWQAANAEIYDLQPDRPLLSIGAPRQLLLVQITVHSLSKGFQTALLVPPVPVELCGHSVLR